MSEQEARAQGMMAELEQQRQWLATRAAQMAGELAVQLKKIEELQKPKEPEPTQD